MTFHSSSPSADLAPKLWENRSICTMAHHEWRWYSFISMVKTSDQYITGLKVFISSWWENLGKCSQIWGLRKDKDNSFGSNFLFVFLGPKREGWKFLLWWMVVLDFLCFFHSFVKRNVKNVRKYHIFYYLLYENCLYVSYIFGFLVYIKRVMVFNFEFFKTHISYH